MGKYTVRPEDIDSMIQNLSSLLDSTKKRMEMFNSNIETNLSVWKGDAKNTFMESKDMLLEEANQYIQKLESFKEYLSVVSKGAIELEEELATQKL